MGRLYAFFFVSGFPALIYQLVWQRSLFTIYGVNSESITVVVSAFLLGLGIGSLLGGALTRQSRVPLLVLFAGIELAIGAFGFASLGLFDAVGHATLGASTASTFLLSFSLVVVPTVLMGATLPILVEHLVRTFGNVGRSVGVLYAVNTFGSAAACFVASLWLLGAVGQTGTVTVAACLNLVVGAGALAIHFSGARRARAATDNSDTETARPRLLPFRLALTLVAVTGFISLSYEILWARAYAVHSGGLAATFPLLLGAFLAGIAGGSLLARRYCSRLAGDAHHLRALAHFVLLANAIGFLTIPVLVLTSAVTWRWTGTLLVVAGAAAMLGATFPLLCHAAIPPNRRAGTRLSYMYVANIAGSVAGGLITGFWLFDIWSMRTIAVFLSLAGLGLGAALFFYSDVRGAALRNRLLGGGAGAVLILTLAPLLFDRAWERLHFKSEYDGRRFAHVVENRSGIIAVGADGTIYGGGMYDGAFSTDLHEDRNHVLRAYALSYFHPNPRRVLMIGLSSGSWAAIIANHPQLESLTVVEINPGYLQLLPKYDAVAPLLDSGKVRIVIDDGRRWLAARNERFDVIVINNTFAWRGHASNLLSVEFLELARAHLQPGGVHYFNCTVSPEALRTACLTFPHARRVQTMVACSDAPLRLDKDRWRKTLQRYALWGTPVFDAGRAEHRARLDEVVGIADRVGRAESEYWATTEPRADILARTRGRITITDDNMGIEGRRRPRLPLPGLD